MLSMYPACFFKEKTSYSVVFPDLNWLSTCGESIEQAMNEAVDCLAGYLYTLKRENKEIPEPTALSDVKIKEIAYDLQVSLDDAFVNIIAVDVVEYAKVHFDKSVKKTLTIPAWLNYAALDKNINFSKVLQEALLEKIQE